MNINKNNVSSILRDKYISTSLRDNLKLTSHLTPFSKLRGIEYLKKDIERYIYNPLFKKTEYASLGICPPNTLLIHGASGVGKTYLVHSISQEYKIPIISGNLENEKDVRETFRKGSLNELSIILFDNLDTLDEEDNKKAICQLSESLGEYRGSAIVIGIVENISCLHQKLRKFDNELLMKIPTIKEREELCIFFSQDTKHSIKDWSEVAKMTPGFTSRDLKKLFKAAGSSAICRKQCFIDNEDFVMAVKCMRRQENDITFDNIGSLEEVKEELKMSIIYPSKFPEKFKRMGITKPSGVLLYGPPGCGKTLLARAVSNMSHCNFISVRGPELISKFVGDSEKEIRSLFSRAKHLQPCVIFFDEIDSLCQKRSKSDFGNRIVNQILTLLDGLEDRGEVYVIAATNRLKILDEALLRPGRFDKIIKVPKPKKEGCIDIFKKCAQNVPLDNFDVSELMLEGFSGAEIAGIVKEAGMMCLKENFEYAEMRIEKKYFVRAIDKFINEKINNKK